MSFFTDALFCCCNTVNFPTVGLIKEHLILSYLTELSKIFLCLCRTHTETEEAHCCEEVPGENK